MAPPKKRRGPGKKSKNAKIGVICTLKIDDSGNARPVNKRIYAQGKVRWVRDPGTLLELDDGRTVRTLGGAKRGHVCHPAPI